MTHADIIRPCVLKQTDPHFPWELRRFGCRVMCLLAIPQYVAGRCLTHDQTLQLIDRGRATPNVIVNSNMLAGRDEHMLIDWAFEMLGLARKGRQVGWTGAHVETREWQYMIVHWQTQRNGALTADGHYTLHDRLETMIYDPHDARQIGYSIDFAGVARKLVYATWAI
jgi:hypothetical protein